MTKPRSRSEEKRLLIQNAATELFCEQGFASTSMDQVAKAAGVSKQTVYSHFGNKDDLFTAAIRAKCVSFEVDSIELSAGRSVAEVLLDMANRFVEMILSEAAMQVHRTCVTEAPSNPQVSRLFYDAGPERVIEEVGRVLQQLSERGDLQIENHHFAAVQFLKMVQGEARMREEYNIEPRTSQAEIDAYLKSCVAMFIRGYSPRQDS
ncbi:TetR/AcrR family transcriptional regulator [Marinobacterium jannaschii]|uniref:TetR/AcrR family transcriptional regulator n=1 Tax=Marinobacterium jannaschii TaxID=64970 RepID=UPI00047FB54E|nr:TetR/AcrR family transcriptional regulator [Marinobacterium jannaschii]